MQFFMLASPTGERHLVRQPWVTQPTARLSATALAAYIPLDGRVVEHQEYGRPVPQYRVEEVEYHSYTEPAS
jgi:hypothetical protein